MEKNPARRFDTCFKSRISVIKFEDLRRQTMEEIWTNFLEIANVEIIETDMSPGTRVSDKEGKIGKLVGKRMNGRLIFFCGSG